MVQASDAPVRYLRSFLTPSWILAVLCSFLGYWTFTVATTWLPAYYEEAMGMSTQQAGSLIALPAIWGFVATIGLSWLTEFLVNQGISTRVSRGVVLGAAATLRGLMVIAGNPVARTMGVRGVFHVRLRHGARALCRHLPGGRGNDHDPAARGRTADHQRLPDRRRPGGADVRGLHGGCRGDAERGLPPAFAFTGGALALCGVLSMFLINQQRDRAKLGLDLKLKA